MSANFRRACVVPAPAPAPLPTPIPRNRPGPPVNLVELENPATIPSGMSNATGNSIPSLSRTDKPNPSIRSGSKEAQQYVGFANFPNQVFRRAIKNGFEFTLMVVGESGLGKSTFVNTLFMAEINDPAQQSVPLSHSTVKIDQKHVKLVENGITLKLTLVDTPGFGDAVDNSKCWEPVVEHIESRYRDYFAEETKIERKVQIPDRCVHLCLYFISPTGHGLKQLDVEFMKKIHELVNVIPVIAKADCLTKDELAKFKSQIQRDIDAHGIHVYKFPEAEDEDEKKQQDPHKQRVPFAIVGSNQMKDEAGKKIRYREYAWGTVEVDNLEHNDFLSLRSMIIRTNLVDLIDVTRNVHYENFRFRQMNGKQATGANNALAVKGGKALAKEDKDPFTRMKEEQNQREKEITKKEAEYENTLKAKKGDWENRLTLKARKIEERETELRQLLESKKLELTRIQAGENVDSPGIAHSSAMSTSKISLSDGSNKTSPSLIEKTKTRKGLGIFQRN